MKKLILFALLLSAVCTIITFHTEKMFGYK